MWTFQTDFDSDKSRRPATAINHRKIVAKSLQNLSALKFTTNESVFYLEIWIGLCFRTESAFPHFGTFYSRQNTFSLPLLRLDNDGTAAGPKTTPNTLDWHLLALFAGWLKVTYQGFDSHPDTYFMAEAEIKKLRSANLFWINQPNNLNLRTKSFLLFRLLEHCLIIKSWSRQFLSSVRNGIYVQLCHY